MSTGISSDQRDHAHGPHGVLFFMILAYLNAIAGCTKNGCRATAYGCDVSCSTGTCAFLRRQLSLHRMRASRHQLSVRMCVPTRRDA